MIPGVDTSRWGSVDAALLVLRVGIGVSFVFVYGADKITGGPSTWADLGQNMALFGVTVWPTVWGFMAALTEFGGGLLLMLGLFFRPVLVFLLMTMTVATASHLAAGEGPWHATEMATVFVALFLLGPGRYSLDAWLSGPPDAEEAPHVG
ncbi:MAG: DoxX family protein [Salinivenus sp.]